MIDNSIFNGVCMYCLFNSMSLINMSVSIKRECVVCQCKQFIIINNKHLSHTEKQVVCEQCHSIN